MSARDKVLITSFSLTQGVIGVNEHSGFQQYTLGNADVTAKVRPRPFRYILAMNAR